MWICEAHAAGAGRAAVEVEWRVARETGRTAETFETFFDVALDQACVHWVLACVFLRFLEDNGLVERPVLGGPGERLDLARERHAAYFRKHPHDSDLDYLLDTFAETARLPGLSGLMLLLRSLPFCSAWGGAGGGPALAGTACF